MREALQNRCNLFVANRDIIKSAFGWESTYIYPLCANMYASKGLKADPARMKECRELLKKNTGVFSNFRGTSKMATMTMLSLSENPQLQMERILSVYNKLKEVFWGSEYLTVAAASIAQLAEPKQYDQIAGRTRKIYELMKSSHPFLTTGEDSAFASLLAVMDLDEVHIEREIERCYTTLKSSFFYSNAVQSLSQVLALGEGSAQQKCSRVIALFDYLKSRGYKYGTNYELATLGVLALLQEEIKVLSEDIIQADDFLKGQKGFGPFGIGAKQRLMYAGMLAACDYIPNVHSIQVAALNGVVALVIAQQAAICASVAATSAATASANSSN